MIRDGVRVRACRGCRALVPEDEFEGFADAGKGLQWRHRPCGTVRINRLQSDKGLSFASYYARKVGRN